MSPSSYHPRPSPMPSPVEVLSRIQLMRQQMGFSLQDLADRIGTTKSQVDKLEKGERRLTLDWLIKIAEGLEIPMSALLAEPRVQGLDEPVVGGYEIPARVPILETTAPSLLPIRIKGDALKGSLQLLDTPSSFVHRPPALQSVPSAFAFYMPDGRCAPRYGTGDLLYVNPERPPSAHHWIVATTPHRAVEIRPFDRAALLEAGLEVAGIICGTEVSS